MMATMVAAQVNRIRDYEQADAPAIARLFYETVRSVNRADYSEEQVEAWAPAIPDAGEWHDRMAGRKTLVAEEGGEVVGFCELEEDGHLDMLYVRRYQLKNEKPPGLRLCAMLTDGFGEPRLKRAGAGGSPQDTAHAPSQGGPKGAQARSPRTGRGCGKGARGGIMGWCSRPKRARR